MYLPSSSLYLLKCSKLPRNRCQRRPPPHSLHCPLPPRYQYLKSHQTSKAIASFVEMKHPRRAAIYCSRSRPFYCTVKLKRPPASADHFISYSLSNSWFELLNVALEIQPTLPPDARAIPISLQQGLARQFWLKLSLQIFWATTASSG